MNRKFDFGNLFWGLLLLFIGTMFLLDNMNVVELQLSYLWRLWPLLIVATGVSLLSIKGWLGGCNHRRISHPYDRYRGFGVTRLYEAGS